MEMANVYMAIYSTPVRNITIGIKKVELRGLLQNFNWAARAKKKIHFGCHIWNQHVKCISMRMPQGLSKIK